MNGGHTGALYTISPTLLWLGNSFRVRSKRKQTTKFLVAPECQKPTCDWLVLPENGWSRRSIFIRSAALKSLMRVTPVFVSFPFHCRVCWVHHITGMWVYPFLEHIGPGARIIFFGSTTILMNFLYLLGEVLNSYIWDTQKSKYCVGEYKMRELLCKRVCAKTEGEFLCSTGSLIKNYIFITTTSI